MKNSLAVAGIGTLLCYGGLVAGSDPALCAGALLAFWGADSANERKEGGES